jgi:hypothetical protein
LKCSSKAELQRELDQLRSQAAQLPAIEGLPIQEKSSSTTIHTDQLLSPSKSYHDDISLLSQSPSRPYDQAASPQQVRTTRLPVNGAAEFLASFSNPSQASHRRLGNVELSERKIIDCFTL